MTIPDPPPLNPPVTDIQIQYLILERLQGILDKPYITIAEATVSTAYSDPTGGPVPVEAAFIAAKDPSGNLAGVMVAADGRVLVDTGLVIPVPQIDALTNTQLRAAPVTVDTGLVIPIPPQPQTDALTNAELRAAPLPTVDLRTLTERMFARAPQIGWRMYLDTADVTYIYLVEFLAGAVINGQGIRIAKDASGNPLGGVAVATDVVWATRGAATWAV